MSWGGGERHIISCVGDLESEKGILRIKLPFEKLESSLWQLRLYEIAFTNLGNDSLNDLLTLSTNFIKDSKYNSRNEVITYFPTLNFFDLALKKANSKIFRPEESWFYVNNISDLLEIYVNYATNENAYKAKCKCFVIFHLQKIK